MTCEEWRSVAYTLAMDKQIPPFDASPMAANDERGEMLPVTADPYWQNLSVQAAARLTRLEEQQKLRAAEGETEQPRIAGNFARRSYQLALMVAVGAGLYAGITYLLLSDLRLPAVSGSAATMTAAPR
jgi:hypothetical protein